MDNKSVDIIKGLLLEADSYSNLELVEKLVEEGKDLSNLPVQPLYMITRNMTSDAISMYLGNFSKEQRQAFLDIDLWEKDRLDIANFSRWPKIYDQCGNDDIIHEFILSDEFLLFLKGRFNIYTFDLDEPEYPDHDNFFITDDHQLLFEFDDQNEIVHEVQNLIKRLYAFEGPEIAYTRLFKVVSEPFSTFQEEEYTFKKGRLDDFGFVDYYDSLSMYSAYPSKQVMDNKIKNVKKLTANIDIVGKMQALHKSSLIAYESIESNLEIELSRINDEKRRDFLQFNFMKLINGSITYNDSLKSGPLAMTRIGKETKSILELGFDYAKSKFVKVEDESIFDYFNFIELFRIGNTLIQEIQREIKKVISKYGFNPNNEYFFGDYWNSFLDLTISAPMQIMKNKKTTTLNNFRDYRIVKEKSRTFISLVPFINGFYKTIENLKESGRLSDSYYLNYAVSEIDFEAIILSSFANFLIGHNPKENSPKMGLSLKEFREFISIVLDEKFNIQKHNTAITDSMKKFQLSYGLNDVYRFYSYLQELLNFHIEGYEFDTMKDDDFRHIGGVIILAI